MHHPCRSQSRWILFLAGGLFFLSGATSLAYEIIWVKILTLQFGSSAWSISLVVASFMAGLGAGSAVMGRFCESIRRPLRAYGLLELGIAAFGIFSVPLLQSMGGILNLLYSLLEGHFGWFVFIRFLLSFAVLFVPTFLMGASLPVLVVGLAGEKAFQQRVGLFYGINTLGGALGVLLAGLIALPAFGINATIWCSVAMGVVVSAGAFFLDRRGGPPPVLERMAQPRTKWPSAVLLGSLALAGCLGITYQIAWTRLLIPIVGSSTYAFSVILTTFLAGIGIGGLLAATPLARRTSYLAAVALAMVFTSCTVLFGLLAINSLPALFSSLLKGTEGSTWMLVFSQAALAGSVFLLPTCAMGVALPVAIAGSRAQSRTAGMAVGGIYAANTLGAIFGSVLTGFVLLPALGAAGSIQLASTLGLVVAIVLLFSDREQTRWRRLSWTFCSALVLGFLLLEIPAVDFQKLHRGVFRCVQAESGKQMANDELVYFREGINATVMVLRNPDNTSLKINGKTDASTRVDLGTQYLLGHFPAFLHERPQDACVIGYGSGATAYAVSTHPGIRLIDILEIESSVLEASKFFQSVNHNVLEDGRVRVHVEDGRTFLRYRPGSYDLIISEPSNPWISGVNSLFTSEFYRQVKMRLKPGGKFCQWIQFYEISHETLSVMLHTLSSEFAHVAVFCNGNDLICVASERPLAADAGHLKSRMDVPAVRRSLERIQVTNPFDLFMLLFASFPEDRHKFQGERKNTDENLWLEYRAPLEMYRGVRPDLRWIQPSEYLGILGKMIKGIDRRRLALELARSLERGKPEMCYFIRGLSKPFEGDRHLSAEIEKLSDAAYRRWEERKNIPAWRNAAQRLLGEGEFSRAAELLVKILEEEPWNGAVHRMLGEALIQLGQEEASLNHFRKAVDIQPDDYIAHGNLGGLLLKMRAARAEEHIEAALKLNPQYPPAWQFKILYLARDSRLEAVLGTLNEAKGILGPAEFEWLEKAVAPIFLSERRSTRPAAR